MPGEKADGSARVSQLIGGYAHMVELLTDREGNSLPIVEGTSPGRQHNTLGSLPLRLFGPALTLKQLKLRGSREDPQDAQSEPDLNHRNACLRTGHQGSTSPGGSGAGKSTNSESAGSCSPNLRLAMGTRTSRLDARRMRRSSSALVASRLRRSSRRSWSLRAVCRAAVCLATTATAPPRKMKSQSST